MKRRPSYLSSPDNTKLDWAVLDGLVRHAVPADLPLPRKFSIYVLRVLFGLSEYEAIDALTDASQDRGVDAVWIDEALDKIHLFQFKYHECDEHVARCFPSRSVDHLATFLDDLLQKRETIFASTNRLLHTKINQIWEYIGHKPAQIHVHLATNGRKLEPAHRSRLLAVTQKYECRLWEYTATNLVVRERRNRLGKLRRNLSFESTARLEFAANGKRMLTGIVATSELGRFLRDPEFPSQIDYRLFVGNVRGILGNDVAVNRAIARTLQSPEAEDFVFFNNGITIVAEQMLYQVGGNFPIEMINPQVVNGCQTASVVFDTCKIPRTALGPNPTVHIRVIESSDPKFTEAVALATNSQTRIYGRDLRALDETQLKIEGALANYGFSYLRKRSDKSERPRSQTIDMARLGQLILAYYLGKPDLAKTKSNDIFDNLYDEVFDLRFLTCERIVTVHLLNNALEAQREVARHRLRSVVSDLYREEWLLEGHFHVLFVLRLLCERDGIDPRNLGGAMLRLEESMEVVGEFAQRHSQTAAYRLFRSARTCQQLEKMVASLQKRQIDNPQLSLFRTNQDSRATAKTLR